MLCGSFSFHFVHKRLEFKGGGDNEELFSSCVIMTGVGVGV